MRALYPHPAARGARYTDNAWGGLYIVSGRLAMPQVGIWQNIVPRFCYIHPNHLLPGTLSGVSFTLMRTIRCLILLALFSITGAINCAALEITRYVSPDGTGNGLSADSPTSDLNSVLKSSLHVDKLTIYAAPGDYDVEFTEADYPNVIFYGGCPDENTDTKKYSTVSQTVGFQNSTIYRVHFQKSLGLKDSNTVVACKIEGGVGIAAWAPRSQVYVKDSFMSSIWAEGRDKAFLYLYDCCVWYSDGYGLDAKNIRVVATQVKFNDHDIAGVNLDAGTAGIGSEFNYCTFNNNGKEGGVITRAISDNIAVSFRNCEFIGNSSEQYNKACALSAFCPVAAYNCVFKDNATALMSHPGEYHESAVVNFSSRSIYRNCTFVDNKKAAFSYAVYPGAYNPGYAQLQSCVFFNNGEDIRTPHGAEPRMANCAITNGTGIPELDAERGIIALNKNNAGLDGGKIVSPNSILINAGTPSVFNDVEGFSRQMVGGTDIGAYEYTPLWKLPAKTAPIIKCGKFDYVVATTEFRGHTFKALAPASEINDSTDEVPFKSYWLYLGEQPTPLKIIDNELVAHYMNTTDGKKLAYLSIYNNDFLLWEIITYEYYTGAAPVARKVDGLWKFVTPASQQAKPSGGSATKKPATSGGSKKPAQRRPGPPINTRK